MLASFAIIGSEAHKVPTASSLVAFRSISNSTVAVPTGAALERLTSVGVAELALTETN
jgi:hypothetical protein